MEKRYETRHIFLALGICLVLSSLLAMVIIPQAAVNAAHKTPETWHVFTSRDNFVLCMIGFFLLASAFFLLYIMDIRTIPILLSLVLVAASAGVIYLSARSYKAFSDEGIEFGYWNEPGQHAYSWEDLDKVILQKNTEDGKERYQFFFKDGKDMVMDRNKYVGYMERQLVEKLRREAIPMQ